MSAVTGLVPGDDLAASQVKDKLDKIRWRQELARRGQERKESVSPELAEALRNEIRAALDAGGRPFDINVARRVYDLAIAARDFCVAATDTVKEAIDQIKDTNGPMETLVNPGTPESQAQVAETYGARILRELLAMTTDVRKHREDPRAIVAAIADARTRGMHDVAAALEQKLLGTPLELPALTRVDVVADSYEHGFVEGSMQDNFERGTIDGCAGTDRKDWSPAYREGYEAGRARRLKQLSPPPGYDTVINQAPCARCHHFKGDHHDRCMASDEYGRCPCNDFVAADAVPALPAAASPNGQHAPSPGGES